MLWYGITGAAEEAPGSGQDCRLAQGLSQAVLAFGHHDQRHMTGSHDSRPACQAQSLTRSRWGADHPPGFRMVSRTFSGFRGLPRISRNSGFILAGAGQASPAGVSGSGSTGDDPSARTPLKALRIPA